MQVDASMKSGVSEHQRIGEDGPLVHQSDTPCELIGADAEPETEEPTQEAKQPSMISPDSSFEAGLREEMPVSGAGEVALQHELEYDGEIPGAEEGKEQSPDPVKESSLELQHEASPEPEASSKLLQGTNEEPIELLPTPEKSPEPCESSFLSLPGTIGETEASPQPVLDTTLEPVGKDREESPQRVPEISHELGPDPVQGQASEIEPGSKSVELEASHQPVAAVSYEQEEESLQTVPETSPEPGSKLVEEEASPQPIEEVPEPKQIEEPSPQTVPNLPPEPETEEAVSPYNSEPEAEPAQKEASPQLIREASSEPVEKEVSLQPIKEALSEPESKLLEEPSPQSILKSEREEAASSEPILEVTTEAELPEKETSITEPPVEKETSPQPIKELESKLLEELSPQSILNSETEEAASSESILEVTAEAELPEKETSITEPQVEKETSPQPINESKLFEEPSPQSILKSETQDTASSSEPILEVTTEAELPEKEASITEVSSEPPIEKEASPQPIKETLSELELKLLEEPSSQGILKSEASSSEPIPEISPEVEPEVEKEVSPQPNREESSKLESKQTEEPSPQNIPKQTEEAMPIPGNPPEPTLETCPPAGKETSPQPVPETSHDPVPEAKEVLPDTVPEAVAKGIEELLQEEVSAADLELEKPQEANQLGVSKEPQQNPASAHSTGSCTSQDQATEASQVATQKVIVECSEHDETVDSAPVNPASEVDKQVSAALQESVSIDASDEHTARESSLTVKEDMPESSPAAASEPPDCKPPEETSLAVPPSSHEEHEAISPISQHSSLAEGEIVASSPAELIPREKGGADSPATPSSSREGSLFSPGRQSSPHGGSSIVSPTHSDQVLESSTNTTTSSSSATGNDELSSEPGAGRSDNSPSVQRMGQSMVLQGNEGYDSGDQSVDERGTLHMSLMPGSNSSDREKKRKKKRQGSMHTFLVNSRKSIFKKGVRRSASQRNQQKVKHEDSAPSLMSPVMTQDWDPTCLLEDLYSDFRPSLSKGNVTGESARYYGYLEKLPKNATKSSMMKGWKRRYFRVMDDKIFYYEDRTAPKALGFVRLSNSRINLIPEKNQIQILEKGGQSIMLRARDKEDATAWHRSLVLEAAHPTVSVPIPTSPLSDQDQDEPSILIIDIGAASVRAGFARKSSSYPEAFFPAVASIESTNYEPIASGNEALIPENRYGAYQVYPRKHNIRMDKHDSNLELRAMECIIDTIVSELDVKPESTEVILTVPPSEPPEQRNMLAEILFDSYFFAAICFQDQCLLSLYSYNTTSGVVVNIGDHIDVVPIIDGYTIEAGVSHLPHGGNAITESLSKLVTSKGLRYFSETEMYIIRLIKEKLCYVSEDYEGDVEKCESNLAAYTRATDLNAFQLPDHRKVVALDIECFKAAEGLFDPNKWGKDVPGIHELVWKAVQASPIDQRREMAKKIYLSGGTTGLPGLKERLEKEVSQLATTGLAVEVHVSETQQHAAFMGASVLATLGSFQNYLVTREEFSSLGFDALKKWSTL